MEEELIIIGGGASGIISAIFAARTNPKLKIKILERKDRVGKKILATGNGCCNITNINSCIKNFYGSEIALAKHILHSFTPLDTINFFREIGVLCKIEEDGKTYPYSYQASSVLDVLRNEISKHNIEVVESFEVNKIENKNFKFTIHGVNSDKKKVGTINCKRVIIATGGKASPSLGSNGSGFALLVQLGHHITKTSPALVQLKTDIGFVKSMQGVKIQAALTIKAHKKVLFESENEILFTEYGISGPAVFEASRLTHFYDHLAAFIDFVPNYTENEIKEILYERKHNLRHLTCENYLTGMIHKKVGQALIKYAGVEKLSLPISEVKTDIINNLASLLKEFKIQVIGPKGFENAQVTAGGALLSEFNSNTLESKKIKGLYAAGEVLDIFGDCGGHNLQWAWASGAISGKSAAFYS